VFRHRAKEILAGLRDWNRARPGHTMSSTTQVSIDAARDPELLQLCCEGGMTSVFIGIKTPNQDSLRETRKRQNVGIDLIEQIEAFLRHGISVTAGMIVGFDHDGPDIFERQFEFAMASAVPISTLSALVAPAAAAAVVRPDETGGSVDVGWRRGRFTVGYEHRSSAGRHAMAVSQAL
jgi:hypothetical protein